MTQHEGRRTAAARARLLIVATSVAVAPEVALVACTVQEGISPTSRSTGSAALGTSNGGAAGTLPALGGSAGALDSSGGAGGDQQRVGDPCDEPWMPDQEVLDRVRAEAEAEAAAVPGSVPILSPSDFPPGFVLSRTDLPKGMLYCQLTPSFPFGYVTANCEVDLDCPGDSRCHSNNCFAPCDSDDSCRYPTTCELVNEGFARCICLDDCDNTVPFTGTPMPDGSPCSQNEACQSDMCYAVRGESTTCMAACIPALGTEFRCTDNSDCCDGRCCVTCQQDGICLEPVDTSNPGVAFPEPGDDPGPMPVDPEAP